MDKVAVLIPCYNEEKTIGKVVKDWKKELPDAMVYVYDNNSTDNTVELAKKAGIPVAVVGSVGGRSGEYAFERIGMQDWSDLNPWGNKLNEDLFYNVNHRLMIRRLLDKIE